MRAYSMRLSAMLLLVLAGCKADDSCKNAFCYGDGRCICDGVVTGDGDSSGTGDRDGDSGGDGEGGDTDVIPECALDPTDSDGDGVSDSCEDRNGDGIRQSTEMDPHNPDTDGDGIPDGVEDANHNGKFDSGETHALRPDTDNDGIPDGDEDKNHNGVVDTWAECTKLSTEAACAAVSHCTWSDLLLRCAGCWIRGTDPDGETDPRRFDSDLDGITDNREDANSNGLCDEGETCAFLADTDCDWLPDGKEDGNGDGIVNTTETDPLNSDTDGDGLLDGIEDANRNGAWNVGAETDPRRIDTDNDGIPDGVEDRNLNGRVDAFVDANGDGCYDIGEEQGESDPRLWDSDRDGLADRTEDRNHDGACNAGTELLETCAWLADSDCDGLADGTEDHNRDGHTGIGETDPRYRDTDLDGLIDGCPSCVNCPSWYTPGLCEDQNNDGIVQIHETDALRFDSDSDGLSDGCELTFDPVNCTTMDCSLDPLADDTDGDGLFDGEEDANQNCVFEEELDETDPRVPNEVPENPCLSTNLKGLTFAESSRPTHDYRVAFEIEPGDKTYFDYTRAIGIDLDGGGFDPNNLGDALWGHAFQSPKIEDPDSDVTNRLIYGLVLSMTPSDGTSLDDLMLELRDLITARYGEDNLDGEPTIVTAREAHDNIENRYPVLRAQLKLKLTGLAQLQPVQLRNELAGELFTKYFDGRTPTQGPPATDQVYPPPAGCPALCSTGFTIAIGAVERTSVKVRFDGDKLVEDPDGRPQVVLVVTLTPHDIFPRLEERETRLEDLTGGSAVARFEADRSKLCEERPQRKAAVDILWVIDDSRSMQQMIGQLQQAAKDAQLVLGSNRDIVDFRVAMTTTNPSIGARTQCYSGCDEGCTGVAACAGFCADQNLGCLLLCPGGCGGAGCSGGVCLDPAFVDTTLAADAGLDAASAGLVPSGSGEFPLPGGGGTFYYEDSEYLDCIATSSSSTNDQTKFINTCAGVSGFESFFNGGSRLQLLDNAGFLGVGAGADPGASCARASMQLVHNPSASSPPASCVAECDRLTAACDDGPTVLVSQMCDLIRAMGGVKCKIDAEFTSGARPHSAPEHGTRSARRLLDKLWHRQALPLDTTDGDAKLHLRLDCHEHGSGLTCPDGFDVECGPHERCSAGQCEPTGNCVACMPGTTSQSATGNTCGDGSECGPGEWCSNERSDPDHPESWNRCMVDCTPVPVLTMFLSDEEDFYFKDECAWDGSVAMAPSQRVADTRQLRAQCYEVDGDPTDAESCVAPEGSPYWEADNPLAYCQAKGYLTGLPAGYDPDATAYRSDVNSTGRWRDAAAPECSPDGDAAGVTCVDDPCPMFANQTACETEHPDRCVWSGRAECALIGDQATCSNRNECTWNATAAACESLGKCRSVCARHTECIYPDLASCNANPGCAWKPNDTPCISKLRSPLATECSSHNTAAACEGNPACEWRQTCAFAATGSLPPALAWEQQLHCAEDPSCVFLPGRVSRDLFQASQREACAMARPLNDCQACKRLERTLQAAGAVPDSLVGLGRLGPVYALIREKGIEGWGDYANPGGASCNGGACQDACKGGPTSWGRGDGLAYREISAATAGRTADVCAGDYSGFMQMLISDAATLSAPYPLTGYPIAATIKVTLGRPDGSYIPVPRSTSSGFTYDPTTNSVGFKSDAAPDICDHDPPCTAAEEIEYARNAVHVPRSGDRIFVSYRYWLDVPCREQCDDGESCVRVICPANAPGPASACTVNEDCGALGRTCSADGVCGYWCEPGGVIDACHCDCGPCEECADGACVPSTNDACVCDPREKLCVDLDQAACEDEALPFCLWDSQSLATPFCRLGNRCDPNVSGSACPPGFACDESCVCVGLPVCRGGFYPDGTIADCDTALQCCEDWAVAAVDCPPQTTSTDCGNTPHCLWDATALACRPEADVCCGPNELVECWYDRESTVVTRHCSTDIPCVCGDACTPGGGECEDWQTCVDGYCTPGCASGECVRMYTGACECWSSP